MVTFKVLWRLLLLLLWCGSTSVADEHVLNAWAEQLSAETYVAREAAARALILAGPQSEATLQAQIRSSDLDVQRRAKRVLTQMRKYYYQRQLMSFARDPLHADPTSLPGWERFVMLVEDRHGSRRLFLDMHCEAGELMEALEHSDSDRLQFLWRRFAEAPLDDKRRGRFSSSLRNPSAITPAQLMGFLFVAEDTRLEVSEETIVQLNQQLSSLAPTEAWQKSPYLAELRTICNAWIAKPRTTKLNYQQVMFGMQHKLPGALIPALRILEDREDHARMRMYAMLAVGCFGGQAHRPLLEELLQDDTTCLSSVQAGRRVEVQIRDVALTVLVHISGQSLDDFGLSQVLPSEITLFRPHSLGFDSERVRQSALQKWKAWQADAK